MNAKTSPRKPIASKSESIKPKARTSKESPVVIQDTEIPVFTKQVSMGSARKVPTRKNASKATPLVTPVAPPPTAIGTSKQTRLITMLRATSGASIDQLIEATGWQAHSVRGVISGVLRKKLGLNVIHESSGTTAKSLYRIVDAAV